MNLGYAAFALLGRLARAGSLNEKRDFFGP